MYVDQSHKDYSHSFTSGKPDWSVLCLNDAKHMNINMSLLDIVAKRLNR